MGHRLSKIYTCTGDDGETGLGDGSRVSKDEFRIEAIGAIDELNSLLGVMLSGEMPDEARTELTEIQHQLFDLGGELSIPGHSIIKTADVERLEQQLDALNADLPMLKEFILPGGCAAAAYCHLARSVCRRAERRLVTLANTEAINPAAIQYINRLSDYLFVLARHLNRSARVPDTLWQHDR
ncbi:MAG TPA: cob(I)yrinic acid a,c-diamide adenosyltransferase [Gammaproteobacteria bacterium]|nr:cob(I)yrinic acid a,c-diamide adenosyltransferase [Gammaproteobacteria bacterium]